MKTLTKILTTTALATALNFNSYGQDTIKTAEGYTIRSKEGYVIQDVVIKRKDKDIYEYNEKGKLTTLTTFSKSIKNRLYTYNEKGQLMTETIYDKEGKINKVINRELLK